MSTLANSLTSTTSRALPVRKRGDLTDRLQRYQGKTYHVVKDPVSLKYFRFEEEEYFLLCQLDGHTSLDEIKQQFERKFRPQTITVAEIQKLIGSLHQSGLIISTTAGQGERLIERHRKKTTKQRFAALSNVLAIRLRGFDPDGMLAWMYPTVRWFLSRAAICGCFSLMMAALLLILVQWDTFIARLPAFHEFFATQNWIWLAVALAVTKVIHEFGHGLACKHFGGECHEMGVMFLVFTPCLYVNVSDSWMLPNKWHRAAIGAAGMYVELVLSAAATLLWWFSEPGTMLNNLCLSTMFVSSVSTVMFNANPLLRYDGYYILSDILEIPNLRQKATTLLKQKAGKWFMGLPEPHDPFLPQRNQTLFATYAVAAAVYRWVVLYFILWFLNKMFEPYGLQIIGQLLACVALYGLIVRPIIEIVRFFHVPGRMYQVKRLRLALSLSAAAGLLWAIFYIPLPSAVYSSLQLEPSDATALYVDVPGKLVSVDVQPGVYVEAGAPIARLENVDVHLAVAELLAEQQQLEARLESLKQRRHRDEQAAMEVAEVRESLRHVGEQLRKRREDLERLNLVAPASGLVLPPPRIDDDAEARGELPTWSGIPLEHRNLGAQLSESTLVCHIGDGQSHQAVLVIDQADIDRVKEGQLVEIIFEQLPARRYAGRIEHISRSDLKATPENLSSKRGGEVVSETDESGLQRPTSTSYQALVPLEDNDAMLRPGLSGRAKIHTRPEPVGTRIMRWASRTFNFEW